jgi:hypothetical protein
MDLSEVKRQLVVVQHELRRLQELINGAEVVSQPDDDTPYMPKPKHDAPSGYEYTVEFRTPRKGETYMTTSGSVVVAKHDGHQARHILRRASSFAAPEIPEPV